jgi:hypothetical protein
MFGSRSSVRLFVCSSIGLLSFDGQDLASAIIAAGGASGVASNPTPALGALRQLRSVPAVGCFPRPQSHFGSLSFGNTHF